MSLGVGPVVAFNRAVFDLVWIQKGHEVDGGSIMIEKKTHFPSLPCVQKQVQLASPIIVATSPRQRDKHHRLS